MITVAVTGPTGDLGRAVVGALERSPEVRRIVGMARRPFAPAEHGWTKTSYVQGDVLDRPAVDALVRGADVVVHLAFVILGGSAQSRRINVEGSRNVFAAAARAGTRRLVYASSVAAYGFHDHPHAPITEDMPARGTTQHDYAAQKAEVEGVLASELQDTALAAYVYRPCVVAGPQATTLIDKIPFVQAADRLPATVRRVLGAMPALAPVMPDNGTPFQLVHHDDAADAMLAGVEGRGAPGAYNLAGAGSITLTDLAHALGWHAVPIPDLALDVAAELIERLPRTPPELSWVQALRAPTLLDTTRAREQLGWRPRHDSAEVLRQTVEAARAAR